jgi:hypothetical protein
MHGDDRICGRLLGYIDLEKRVRADQFRLQEMTMHKLSNFLSSLLEHIA